MAEEGSQAPAATSAVAAAANTATAGDKRQRHNDCQIVKRNVHKSHGGELGYIYVKRDTNPHALVKRVRKLLVEQAVGKVTLVGMGAAITTTCDLALRVQGVLGGPGCCRMQVITGTVDIVDEVLPDDADADEVLQRRRNSKIEIVLSSARPIPAAVRKGRP